MSDVERWGVGDQIDSKAFGHATVDGKRVELIHGEHPHMRNDYSTYARWPNGDVEGFAGHRVQIKVEVETSNYLKTSGLSGNQVRRSCECKIWMDGFLAYAFSTRDPDKALLKAAVEVLPKLQEHHVALWDPMEREKLIGRKVWYENTPAVIDGVYWDQGCVGVVPDSGFTFPKPWWAYKEEEGGAEWDGKWAKVGILSSDIVWIRD